MEGLAFNLLTAREAEPVGSAWAVRDELRNRGTRRDLRRLLRIPALAAAVFGGLALGAVSSSRQVIDQAVFVRGILTCAGMGIRLGSRLRPLRRWTPAKRQGAM